MLDRQKAGKNRLGTELWNKSVSQNPKEGQDQIMKEAEKGDMGNEDTSNSLLHKAGKPELATTQSLKIMICNPKTFTSYLCEKKEGN